MNLSKIENIRSAFYKWIRTEDGKRVWIRGAGLRIKVLDIGDVNGDTVDIKFIDEHGITKTLTFEESDDTEPHDDGGVFKYWDTEKISLNKKDRELLGYKYDKYNSKRYTVPALYTGSWNAGYDLYKFEEDEFDILFD